MGKSLADAMNAQPGPDSLAYWLAPLKGYWDRQGRMASQGLQMADQGAQAVRGGDMGGLAGMLLGPVGYLSSPINALFPERSEVEAATDVPNWSKPLIAGGLETMAIMAPGPKGPKGLGRGMAELADDATDAERAALAGRLEAEAGQAGGAPSAVSRDQALANMVQGEPEGILAYHGSPHRFDKFDMSKIGTGEGAQAYGHGLYFAEDEGVARHYRDVLSKPTVTSGAQVLDARGLHAGSPKGHIAYALEKSGGDLNAALASLEEELKGGRLMDFERADYQEAVDRLRANPGQYGFKPATPSMYQVRLNVKPDELLDWDRPLSEQPEVAKRLGYSVRSSDEIQTEAERLFQEHGQYPNMPSHAKARLNELQNELDRQAPNSTGEQFYRGTGENDYLHSVLSGKGPTKEQSDALKAQGIKGIRYKDAGSRGAEGGTYNFVIFDDKLVDILKRYGVAMTAGAGGAMIVSGQNMPPDVAAQLDLQG